MKLKKKMVQVSRRKPTDEITMRRILSYCDVTCAIDHIHNLFITTHLTR